MHRRRANDLKFLDQIRERPRAEVARRHPGILVEAGQARSVSLRANASARYANTRSASEMCPMTSLIVHLPGA